MTVNVLIIEDQEGWQEIIRQILETMDIQVIITKERSNAHVLLDTVPIDLVIVDVSLSDDSDPMSERAQTANFLHHLQKSHREVKSVLLTAYGTLSFALDAWKKLGVDDFFEKDGLDIVDFERRIRTVLNLKDDLLPKDASATPDTDADKVIRLHIEKRKHDLMERAHQCLKDSYNRLFEVMERRKQVRGGKLVEADEVWLEQHISALESQCKNAIERVTTIEQLGNLESTTLWLEKECNKWLGSVAD